MPSEALKSLLIKISERGKIIVVINFFYKQNHLQVRGNLV
jgi:hypothetical protein